MKYCCLASFILCVMVACCFVQASSGGLITGLITDSDAQPLSNVTVMLTESAGVPHGCHREIGDLPAATVAAGQIFTHYGTGWHENNRVDRYSGCA